MSESSGPSPVAGGAPTPTMLVAFVVAVLAAIALVVIFGGDEGAPRSPSGLDDEEERAIEAAAARGAYGAPGERPVYSPAVRRRREAPP